MNQDLERYDFEIVLSNKYPFRDPLILCHTDFTNGMLSLDDGRDLFSEIVGEGGWKVGHKLYSLIQLIPEFIAEIYLIENDYYTIGTFHLGQVYNLRQFLMPNKKSAIFACQEQVDEEGEEFQIRHLCVT